MFYIISDCEQYIPALVRRECVCLFNWYKQTTADWITATDSLLNGMI